MAGQLTKRAIEASLKRLLLEKPFNKITVAESILMGDVPSHYSYFSQFDTAREAADAQRDYSAE